MKQGMELVEHDIIILEGSGSVVSTYSPTYDCLSEVHFTSHFSKSDSSCELKKEWNSCDFNVQCLKLFIICETRNFTKSVYVYSLLPKYYLYTYQCNVGTMMISGLF